VTEPAGHAATPDVADVAAGQAAAAVGSPLIILVGGVAGTGKTTVGSILAARLGWEFADADAFHSATAIAKMRSGRPLSEADRAPWLARICAWMDERISAGQPAVGGCSALRRSYRQRLLAGRPRARLVFLTLSGPAIAARLASRHGHFFTARLLDSQLAEVEPVQPDEPVLTLDAARPPAALASEILRRLGLAAA
jgi:gluconokinase